MPISNTSFRAAYEVLRGDAVMATGRSAQVFFDYASQKPAPIPDAFRERIAEYEAIAPVAQTT